MEKPWEPKVGDWVEVIRPDAAEFGKVYQIASINPDGPYYRTGYRVGGYRRTSITPHTPACKKCTAWDRKSNQCDGCEDWENYEPIRKE